MAGMTLGPAGRNGNDREGSKEEDNGINSSKDKLNGESGKRITARRNASYGGEGGDSAFQGMIGGPFGGQTKDARSKAERMAAMPC